MKNLLDGLSTTLFSHDNYKLGDYIGEAGLLMCVKCHTPKQTTVKWPGVDEPIIVACLCDCEKAADEKAKEENEKEKRRKRIETLRHDGLTDPEYQHWMFSNDDRRQPKVSDACQKYVAEFDRMKRDNVGLLFFGDIGTGKSFLACCIANALIENGVPALVTNFPRILNKLQSSGWGDDRNEFLDHMQKYDLVVIDDLGVERNTPYALEQVYNVIDSRYRSGKPLIITTNLAPADIKRPENIALKRIYDRILECCQPVKLTGESRRVEIAEQKRRLYQEFLGL